MKQKILEKKGKNRETTESKIIVDKKHNSNTPFPWKVMTGVSEDFQKTVLNIYQQLVLIRRSNNNKGVIITND